MEGINVTETTILIASVLSAITVIIVFGSKIFKVLRKFVRFLDDFNGTDERPGQDRRPGFSERIKDVENSINDMSVKIGWVQHKVMSIEKELHPNHGTSMRDAVDRIQLRLEVVEEKLNTHVSK